MDKRTRLTLVLRAGILVAIVLTLLVWAGSRDTSVDAPPSGLRWLQRHQTAPQPTVLVAPRRPLLPGLGPTSTPPAAQPGGQVHPVTTEALSSIGAAEYHLSGYTGRGVKVAVVDTQFDGFDRAIADGEIPQGTAAWRLTAKGDLVHDLRFGVGSHGTACAEVVHDLAPEAGLVLIQTDSFLQTAEALFAHLAQADVDIVTLSLSVLSMGRADGSGVLGDPPVPIYDLLRDAHETGDMLIVISAGNYARQHYAGRFRDADGDDLHEFGCSGTRQCDETIRVSAHEGEPFAVYLSWDDWGPDPDDPLSTSTYDLLVTDPENRLIQSPVVTQAHLGPPVEMLRIQPPRGGDYTIQIRRGQSTTDAHSLRLWLTGATMPFSDYQTPGSSLGPPADAKDVVTVGAANVATGLLLTSSSQGPTADGRIKPDIISYAHVSVSQPTYGQRGFSGTSAATPHVAGIAALLLDRMGHGTSAHDLRDQVLRSVTDHGVVGPDPLWGNGLAALPPLGTRVTILAPTTTSPQGLDELGRLTIVAEVRRSDGSHIGGLGVGAFQLTLENVPGAVVAAQDLGDRYLLRARWVPDPVPVEGADTLLGTIRLTARPLEASPAGSDIEPGVSPRSTPAPAPRSGPELTIVPLARTLPIGAPIPLLAALEDGRPIPDARVVVEVSAPVARRDHLLLIDDGLSGDGTAGDGVYGGRYPATQVSGTYVLQIAATSAQGEVLAEEQITVDVATGLANWDGDGLPGGWETAVGLSGLRDDRFRDPDADGLTNEKEYLLGSDPHNWDTDGDTLSDHAEVTGYYATSPYDPDTDLGGVSDADEVAKGADPLDPTDDQRAHDLVYLPLAPRLHLPPRLPPRPR